jgi:hypothetical protein
VSGSWDAAHGTITDPVLYGSSSYPVCAMLLAECDVVEDWGCGGGGFTAWRTSGYVGVDSSASPYADVSDDLVDYRSDVDGVLLRHVLEHNWGWEKILTNALGSFRRRLVVVVFTPPVDETHLLHTEPDYGNAPTLAFRIFDLVDVVERAGLRAETSTVESPDTAYGIETFLVVDR